MGARLKEAARAAHHAADDLSDELPNFPNGNPGAEPQEPGKRNLRRFERWLGRHQSATKRAERVSDRRAARASCHEDLREEMRRGRVGPCPPF